uniref:ABC transporter B family member 29, chloroplastic n=1 Tax=Kalanchoe fedtschenkoi TaxID=63787 RepID=A0A7N0V0H4_KALFE
MSLLQIRLSSPSLHSTNLTLRLNPSPTLLLRPTPSPKCRLYLRSSLAAPPPKPPQPHYRTLRALSLIKPFVQSEWRAILLGWVCSAASVYALSRIVPKVGNLASVLTAVDRAGLRDQGLVIAAAVLGRSVASYWQQALLWGAALRSVDGIRAFAFGRVLGRDLGFFEGSGGVSSGDVAYRITAEASDVADTVYSLLNTIVPSTLQLAAMATQMVIISPALSLVSTLVVPCVAFLIAYLGEKLRKVSKRANLSMAALSAYLNEVLPAILFVKANNSELQERHRFRNFAAAELTERLKKKKMKVLIPQVVQMTYFGSLSVFLVGSQLVSGGSFDASNVVAFLASLGLLIDPIQGLGKAYNELKEGEPAIERLFDLARCRSQVTEKPDAVDLKTVSGDVKFCDISFQYGQNSPLILNGLNLHIKPGETVALVGPSGGGKTTLAKLILRLYNPSHGSIYIDNHDISSIRLESLRSHVGLVSQDVTLFTGTVAENIGYRDLMTEIDMERVEHAARVANADEFIRTLPEQYDTKVGPRGSRLSGGQKQRISIARAIYQNCSILILDEATSALDSQSELLVRQALLRLMEDRTVLVIAHKLETVMTADRIFLLVGGTLREIPASSLLSDHHESLIASGIVI